MRIRSLVPLLAMVVLMTPMVSAQTGTLGIAKSVDTNGDGVYADNGVEVNLNDTLTYRIAASSAAGTRNTNVVVDDTLSSQATYVPASTTLDGGSVADAGTTSPLLAGGFDLGQMGGGTFSQTDWSTGNYSSKNATMTTPSGALSLASQGFGQDTAFSAPGAGRRVDGAPSTRFSGQTRTYWTTAALRDGNYAFIWGQCDPYPTTCDSLPIAAHEIHASVFSHDGVAIASNILVSNPGVLTNNIDNVSIAPLGDGFVVAWIDYVFGGPQNATTFYYRRYSATGTPLDGAPIVLKSGSPLLHQFPAKLVDTDAAGNLYFVYLEVDAFFVAHLYYQKISSSGSVLIAETDIGDGTSAQAPWSFDINELGQLQAIWQDANTYDYYTDQVSASGVDGVDQLIGHNEDVPFNAGIVDVSAMPNQGFVLVWEEEDCAGCGHHLLSYARVASGGALTTPPTVLLDVAFYFGWYFSVNVDVDQGTGLAMVTFAADMNAAMTAPGARRIFGLGIDPSNATVIPVQEIVSDNVNIGSGLSVGLVNHHMVVTYFANISTPVIHTELFARTFHLPAYLSPGILESSVYDAGKPVSWLAPLYAADAPFETSYALAVRTGDTATPDGSWQGYVNLASGQGLPANLQGHRYVQYRVTLTSRGANAPAFYDFTMASAAESHIFTFQATVTAKEGTVTNVASVFSDQDAGATSLTITNPIKVTTTDDDKEKDREKDKDKDKIFPPVRRDEPPPPTGRDFLKRLLLTTNFVLAALALVYATGLGAGIGFGVYTIGAVGLYLLYLFTEPLRALFAGKKKQWGTVYNSLSKQPVDLAIVRLFDADGKLLKTRITDKKGRYQFLIDESQAVHIQVVKNGYAFPSTLVTGSSDTAFDNLNHGENINANADQPIIPNLPVDPPVLDGSVAAFNKRKFKNALGTLISSIGGVIALVTAILYPSWLTWGIVVLHVLLFLLFRRLAKPKVAQPWGVVYDASNDGALPQTIARIFDKQYNRLLDMTQSDRRGRYAFLADKNQFYATFEHPDYQSQTTDTIDLTHKPEGGIVNLDVPMTRP